VAVLELLTHHLGAASDTSSDKVPGGCRCHRVIGEGGCAADRSTRLADGGRQNQVDTELGREAPQVEVTVRPLLLCGVQTGEAHGPGQRGAYRGGQPPQ